MIVWFIILHLVQLHVVTLGNIKVQEDIVFEDAYSAKVYNNLPDCHEISHNAAKMQSYILELGQTFVNYGVNEDLGLSLLHKHFDLISGEKLVEVIDVDSKTATIMPVTVAEIIAKNETVIPFRLQFSSNCDNGEQESDDVQGFWVPLEFSLVDDTNNPFIVEKYMRLKKANGFLNALGKQLTDLKLQNYFGIGIKTRDHGTWEKSIGSRKLLVQEYNSENREKINNPGISPMFYSFSSDNQNVAISDICAMDDCNKRVEN